MRIIEYRLYMPLTVAENQIAQLWSFAELSRVNTSGGEGVKILHTQEFEVPLDKEGRILNHKMPDYDQHTDNTSINNKSTKTNKKTKSKENNIPNLDATKFEDDEELEDLEISNTKDNINSCTGQYTKKNYYMASKFPWYIRKILPINLATLHERSWNMYPTVKTIITNDYFKNNFRIQLDTIAKNANGGVCDENAHNLTQEQLAKREIIVIDIADQVAINEYKIEEDPLKFKSVKSGRGPLVPGWINTHKTVICIHKLVTMDFKVFGLQTKVESYLKNMYVQLFRTFHRQVFCYMDGWYGLKMSEVREIEERLAKLLLEKISEGEIASCALLASE